MYNTSMLLSVIQNGEKERATAIVDMLNEELSGTGNVIRIDIYPFFNESKNAISYYEFDSLFITALQLDGKLLCTKESDYIYKIETLEKFNVLANLNKTQKLIYMLKDINPELVAQAIEKMTKDEAAQMKVILSYQE